MSGTLVTDTVGVQVEGNPPPEASGQGVAWPAIVGGAFAAALSMPVGAFIACVVAALGGQQRDEC